MNNEPESLHQTSEWKRQAAVLRQTSGGPAAFQDSEYSEWQQVLIWCFIILVLVGSFYLLLVPGHRRGLIAGVGSQWARWSGGQEPRVYSLPPPPPKVVEPTIVNAEPFVVDLDDDTDADPYSVLNEESDTIPTPARPLKNEAFQAAFRVLLAESDVAGDLVEGGLEGIEFKEWNPLQDNSPELWLELVGVKTSSGEEQKYIWSVNVQTNEVSAKSQAARDMERARRNRK